MTRVLVIGGGISGLAAAWELTHPGDGGAPAAVVLAEAGDRLGGVIATRPFAGTDLDTGPDAFLARVPAAAQLAREAGLGDALVAPGTGQAWLWTRGRLRRLPTGLALGVPVDLAALARSGVLPLRATARAALDLVLPGRPVGPDEDVAVGELVRRRLGAGVQLGLVDRRHGRRGDHPARPGGRRRSGLPDRAGRAQPAGRGGRGRRRHQTRR
jgi:oxygen-dependent protoporphyrinogen oxidase